MPAGSQVSDAQRSRLQAAVARAESATGLRFHVRVGPLTEGRATAEESLARCAEPASTVLVAVDPASRSLEILTGAAAADRLDDRSCGLAALAMTSSFQAGDLVGGIVDGLRVLSDHTRSAEIKHLGSY